MCTPSQKWPFGSFSIVIASSKSRACSPSIVTVGTPRKSVRPANIALGHGRPEPDGFRDGLGRVRIGNPVLPDDDFRVDARRIDVAEHFGDAADGAARGRRPPGQFHRHHVARRRAAFLARRDDDVHQHAAVERHDVAHAVFVAIVAADERLVAALEDPDDAPFRTPVVLDALDAHDDTVAVHRFVEMRAARCRCRRRRVSSGRSGVTNP